MKISTLLQHIEAAVREEWANLSPSGDEVLKPDIKPGLTPKVAELVRLYSECSKCQRCALHATATNLVFGEGDPDTGFMVIGEAPGADEDAQSRPFVGRSGRLLRASLAEAGMPPASVFIGNILKHRPPDNRDPLPAEIEACTPFLLKQLQIIQPKIIVTLGNFSTKFLLATETGISRLRGKVHKSPLGFDVFPTFHPSAVLRSPKENTPLFKSDLFLAIEYFKGVS